MKNTYLFTGNYEITYIKYLIQKLNNDEWDKYSIKNKNPDLLFFFHDKYDKYDHKYYDIETKLQNILAKGNNGVEIITDKYNLYFNMLKYEPEICKKHMMKSYKIDKNFKVNDKVYIIKPVGKGFYSGNGIHIITTQKEYDKLFPTLKSNKYIISEYLVNPFLLYKKKFHLRVYFLVTNINNKTDWSVFNTFEVVTSKENYKMSDYTNTEIHDTHFKYNLKDIFLNNHTYKMFKITISEYNYITNQIFIILKSVFNLVKKHSRPYKNAKNAFEIFGCDFLIDDNLIVYLLEINDHIGLRQLDPDSIPVINFEKKMARWIYDKTIIKTFY